MIVNEASGFHVLSFLDAYSGYNQIRMHDLDEEKMTFIIEDATFCYRVMAFILKNAGATYYRLMDQMFKQLIKHKIKVYVDNIVVKSQSIAQHGVDLEEVFEELLKYDMCLNHEKCTFEKCTAILDMHSLTNVHEVQKLNGRLASLSRFLPKLAEKSEAILQIA